MGVATTKENPHAAHIRETGMATASLAAREEHDHAARTYALVLGNLATSFRTLAGSQENARILVEALREGRRVRLVGPSTPEQPAVVTAFDPPTGEMTWNDVKLALMLARDALMAAGVTRPVHAQLHAALMGGEVSPRGRRPVTFSGVLKMRAEGMNWGRVAAARYMRPTIGRMA
jgi:hypothetical protein